MATSGRTLERSSRARSTKKKQPQATLVLANGDNTPESMRIGLVLVSAGLTGVSIGVLEGLARQGKVKWYGDLTPAKKATLLLAIFFAAGAISRWRRGEGDYKGACAAESVAIAAFTIFSVVLVEAMYQDKDGELKGLGLLADDPSALANLSPAQLDKLDSYLDDDIRKAARDLRVMQERGELALPAEEDDVAGLNAYGFEATDIHDEDEELDF